MTEATATRRAEWWGFLLGGLPGVALAIVATAGLVPERIALTAFAASFVGLNLMHNAATWSRAWADPDERAAAWPSRVLVPALLVAGCLCADALGGAAILLGAQYYLSIHHGAMQNYGLLRHTQRRAGRAVGRRLDQAACLLLPIGALLYRARAVTDRYDGARMPHPPLWLAAAVIAAGGVALAAFVIREATRRDRSAGLLGPTIVVATALLWSGLIVGLAHPALPLYAIASGHYVQYLYFVARVERRPRAETVAWLARLLVTGGVVVSALTLASLATRAFAGTPDDTLLPPWAAAMIGVNLSHYWLDSRIWRRTSSAVRRLEASPAGR